MQTERNFWGMARWPLLVVVIGVAGIVTATVVDMTLHSEWTLTVGAASVTVLAFGLIWLVATVVEGSRRRRSL